MKISVFIWLLFVSLILNAQGNEVEELCFNQIKFKPINKNLIALYCGKVADNLSKKKKHL